METSLYLYSHVLSVFSYISVFSCIICILIYKVKHSLCPNSICNIFIDQTSAYNLRQSDFSTPRYNTVTYGRHSLRYLGPKL